MTEQQNSNQNRIAKAIEYIKTIFKEQVDLDKVGKKVPLSPFHFQRLFNEWTGTSPKKFLQFTTDGNSRLELYKYINPKVIEDHRCAPVNALGYFTSYVCSCQHR